MGRAALSYPARQALMDGVVSREVLDYGSGRGGDARRLAAMDFHVQAWDPYFTDVSPRAADTVLLTYVLNVIEDPDERRAALANAWELARANLVVSARLKWEQRWVQGDSLSDGVVTSRGTFQHLFTPDELRAFVSEVTGVQTVVAAPGLVYAFRSDRDRLGYLARRVRPEVDWLASTDASSALGAVVDFFERRGRAPEIEEMPGEVIALLKHIRAAELRRLAVASAEPTLAERGARRSTLDTLLLLGMEIFNGRGGLQSLPLSTQADVRAFFGSYREACRRADRLLLKLKDDAYVRGAMHNSVGKMTATALYTHRSAVEQMPVILRLYEYCASIAAGRPSGWQILKLGHVGRQVSWLAYPEFDSDPHPKLAWSYHVDLPTLRTGWRSYEQSSNRPLLHRKEEFLADNDARSATYARLTRAEMRAGLYEEPSLIGTEQGWSSVLADAGYELRGHRLVRRREPSR